MLVLIGCEESQEVCKAFRQIGHEAYSCDLQPCSGGHPEWHLHGDIKLYLYENWDLIIGHPPCDFLANSGNRWYYHPEDKDKPAAWRRPHPLYPTRQIDRQNVVNFFKLFTNVKIKCPVVIENPIPNNFLTEQVGTYHQLIHPWQYGHKAMKSTCLWLYGVPPLVPTDIVGHPPKDKEEKKKWEQVYREPPGPNRKKNRSKTFPGIAKAMAEQWGI